MSIPISDNRRIAKNTLFLYFRQMLVIVVSLYTVRVVLAALGVEDYGIYNVVGGFVAMFNILSGALSVAISRFITYEMGQEGDKLFLQKIYSSSVIIQIGMGFFIVLLLVTFGVWFVREQLVIPQNRLNAAVYVLLFSTISFFVNLLSVPYNALIIAHEQMKAFAYISIVEAVLKLLVAFLLIVLSLDKLILYGLCTVIVSCIICFSYAFYCKRHFEECCFILEFDKKLLSRMFAFSGWAFLGNGSFVMKEQGVNILLNMFCGPVVNAARAITTQVTTAVTMFVSNFMQAVNPQITKSYSSGNLENMRRLIFNSSRFSFFLLLLLGLPLMKNADYILGLWLVSVPEYASLFIQLLLIFCLMDCLVQPLMTGLLAEGNIRTYEFALVVLNVGNVMLSYLALKHGIVPGSVYVVSILIEVGVMWVRIYLSSKAYGLSVKSYCMEVCGKSIVIATLAGGITYWISLPFENAFWNCIITSILIVLVTVIVIWTIGLSKHERFLIFSTLSSKLSKFAIILRQ
ncbi:lipopolysaccharide biosynthesis protein [Bacteroides faecichinchillae]|uniref:lipopolysaccharide biosynthesis protein n=1 Tax=Bacteroides faecichinchillae TaxID=871325 RepID=UPI00351682A3